MGGRGRRISEFEASLVYRVSSRTDRAIQRNPVLKKQNKTKTKKPQNNNNKKTHKKRERERANKEKTATGIWPGDCHLVTTEEVTGD